MKKLIRIQPLQLGIYLYEGSGGSTQGTVHAQGCIIYGLDGSWSYGWAIICQASSSYCIKEDCQ